MEKRINITAFEIYLLSLIKMEYINKEKSFIGDDGNIYLNLDVELLPIPNIKVVSLTEQLQLCWCLWDSLHLSVNKKISFIRMLMYIV